MQMLCSIQSDLAVCMGGGGGGGGEFHSLPLYSEFHSLYHTYLQHNNYCHIVSDHAFYPKL